MQAIVTPMTAQLPCDTLARGLNRTGPEMWPFKRRREREQLRAAFTRYLADEVADELLNNPGLTKLETQRADICFILLQVRDDHVD
jgi:hypothetical protein